LTQTKKGILNNTNANHFPSQLITFLLLIISDVTDLTVRHKGFWDRQDLNLQCKRHIKSKKWDTHTFYKGTLQPKRPFPCCHFQQSLSTILKEISLYAT